MLGREGNLEGHPLVISEIAETIALLQNIEYRLAIVGRVCHDALQFWKDRVVKPLYSTKDTCDMLRNDGGILIGLMHQI